jgi:phospholipid-transporting ATPase
VNFEFDPQDLKTQELNKISTSKYNFINAIPKILLEQFSKMANIYFLIIAFMQV